ncbi:hypothetical protein [Polaribacter sp. 20A6]|uniref:hypothetical protein n=1 Tax=Polaribacter sp. 20A6 TaxID=2687289 RepID=UPI0013FD8323|nr:hypothetical protein [Polaribacter sp. 20A6]
MSIKKKKLLIVFVNKSNYDNYENSGTLKLLDEKYDLKIWYDGETNYASIQLPQLDFNGKIEYLKYLKEKASLKYFDTIKEQNTHTFYRRFKRVKGFKNALKFKSIIFFSNFFKSDKGILFLEKKLNSFVEKTSFYKKSTEILKKENPDMLLITHQSTSITLGVSLAAKKNNVQVLTSIHSWDNIVKGNKLVDADYYVVWSNYMKNELVDYYPTVKKETVFTTGTPQFHDYNSNQKLINREDFFREFKIPKATFYICFSANFKAIGQDEPQYLEDLILEVKKHNISSKENIHIIFRPHPTEGSNRFDNLLSENSDNVTKVIHTKNTEFNASQVLFSIIYYTDAMINVGSTMGLDATLLNKPAFYLDYTVKNSSPLFSIDEIYKLVHFKSLKESDNAIYHIKSKSEFAVIFKIIKEENNVAILKQKKWAKTIVKHPIEGFAENYINVLSKII